MRFGCSLEPDAESLVVIGDEQALSRVLGNLIGNAAKYSPGDSPVDVRVAREVRPFLGDAAVIEISDRGPGSPPRCARGSSSLSSGWSAINRLPGTGLGLAVVRNVIAAHDGHVQIVDREGGGTVIRVELPAQPPLSSTSSSPTRPVVRPPRPSVSRSSFGVSAYSTSVRHSSGNSMPAARAASGTSDVAVMPGIVLVSSSHTEPSSATIVSEREIPRHPEQPVRGDREPLAFLARTLADSRWNDVPAHSRNVLRVVVVELVLRIDLERRQRRYLVVAENRHRDLDAVDEALDDDDTVVLKRLLDGRRVARLPSARSSSRRSIPHLPA